VKRRRTAASDVATRAMALAALAADLIDPAVVPWNPAIGLPKRPTVAPGPPVGRIHARIADFAPPNAHTLDTAQNGLQTR